MGPSPTPTDTIPDRQSKNEDDTSCEGHRHWWYTGDAHDCKADEHETGEFDLLAGLSEHCGADRGQEVYSGISAAPTQ